MVLRQLTYVLKVTSRITKFSQLIMVLKQIKHLTVELISLPAWVIQFQHTVGKIN